MRLVGGVETATQISGRVEIFRNNSWYTVCDDYWDTYDARVVCRQLGYDHAISAPRYSHFGQGSGGILLDYLSCTGNEETLLDCSHRGEGVHGCSHTEDAGAVCFKSIGKEKLTAMHCAEWYRKLASQA